MVSNNDDYYYEENEGNYKDNDNEEMEMEISGCRSKWANRIYSNINYKIIKL